MRLRVILATAVSLLCCAVTAHADTISDTLPTARAQWPNSPCAGVEQVTVGDATAAAGKDAWGAAWQDGSCRTIIDTRIINDPYKVCIVLTHELGHLAGLGRLDTGIMSPMAIDDYPPCYPFHPDLHFDSRLAAIAVPINGHWRVRCSKTTDYTAVCVGRLGHHAERRWVARLNAANGYVFERL